MKFKPLCVLVDDEEYALASLRRMVEELDILEIEKAYLDPDRFLVDIDQLHAQIILLDLEMPISGIEVAQKLKDKLVIFVSGKTERGYETFAVDPVDFVPKPIRLSRLKTAIEKALNGIESKSIVVKTVAAKRQELDPQEIAFVTTSKEGDSRNKIIHLVDGNLIHVVNTKFEAILSQSSKLLQVNPGTVVNLDKVIQVIDADSIGVRKNDRSDIESIILGHSYRDSFYSRKPHLK